MSSLIQQYKLVKLKLARMPAFEGFAVNSPSSERVQLLAKLWSLRRRMNWTEEDTVRRWELQRERALACASSLP